MSEPIKFRVFDNKTNQFCRKFVIDEDGKLLRLVSGDKYECTDDYFEVSYFTGLIDKNGKEIYTGDVLECAIPIDEVMAGYSHSWWERGIVKYYPEFARYGLEFHSPFGGEGYTGIQEDISNYISGNGAWWVIGNIFENPDLV